MVTHTSIVAIKTQPLCLIMFIVLILMANLLATLLFEEMRRKELKRTKRLFNQLFNQENGSFFFKNIDRSNILENQTRYSYFSET